MEQDGVIEEDPTDEFDTVPSWPVHYLPHRLVVKEISTSTKIRPLLLDPMGCL